MSEKMLTILPADSQDRPWVEDLWRTECNGEFMVTRGRAHYLSELSGVIAWEGTQRVGAATYRLDGDECELMSINALTEGLGVGSHLLAAVERAARDTGCRRLFLITTNDNLNALRFYQRKGYRIVKFYPGAVDEARQLKPSIPTLGFHEIPIHDEIEVETML